VITARFLAAAIAAAASGQSFPATRARACACAECHGEEAAPYTRARMANSPFEAAESKVPSSNALLEWGGGRYSYRITRQGERSFYSVRGGEETLAYELLFAFGNAKAGQTLLYTDGGLFHETRVS
jgi:hypothetical protein